MDNWIEQTISQLNADSMRVASLSSDTPASPASFVSQVTAKAVGP